MPRHSSSLSQNNTLNLIDLFHIVRQRWRIGAAVGFIAAGLVAIGMLNQQPVYRTTATMMVEFDPDRMIQLQDVAGSRENNAIYDTIINAYIERLQSRSMAGTIAKGLTEGQQRAIVQTDSDASPSESNAEQTTEAVAGIIRTSISAEWNARVQTITITARHSQPNIAKLIADAYADALISMQSSRLTERTQLVLGFLEDQSEDLQDKIESGENQLQQYRRDNNLGSIEGRIDLISQSLSQLGAALNSKNVEIIAQQNQIDQIDQAKNNLDALLEISFISNRPRIENLAVGLNEALAERTRLAQTFGERHPKMLDNQALIDSRRALLEKEVFSIISEIRNDFLVTKSSYDSLKDKLAEAEAEALELDRLSIEYRVLERQLAVERQIYDQVAEKFTSTDISSQLDLASIQILDPALLPGAPYTPDPLKAALISGFLFIGAFLSLPVGLELLDNSLKTFADIENFVGKPVFGDIKRHTSKTDEALARGVIEGDQDLTEPFRGIYSSLKLQTNCKPPYGLIITSALPSEGKTFVATNLAATFAKHQMRTLLVDCDLRRPSVHRAFDFKNEVGLIEWIESGKPLPGVEQVPLSKELGIFVINDHFHVLLSGGSTREPTEIIGNERFNRLMSRLREAYDALIFDTPPSGLFPDAALTADFAGQTLFVAKQKGVTRQKVRFAVNRFERTNAPVAGVVLNHITGNAVATGYGYYGQNYSYAYGYERDQAKYQKYYDNAPD